MAEIKVPKPPRNAFNPNRPASDLLRHQVEHLEWAVRHAGERRRGYKVKPVRTEADAAARMASLIPRLESASRLPFGTSEIPGAGTPAARRKSKKSSNSRRKRSATRKTRR